jgi:hypothetical protein
MSTLNRVRYTPTQSARLNPRATTTINPRNQRSPLRSLPFGYWCALAQSRLCPWMTMSLRSCTATCGHRSFGSHHATACYSVRCQSLCTESAGYSPVPSNASGESVPRTAPPLGHLRGVHTPGARSPTRHNGPGVLEPIPTVWAPKPLIPSGSSPPSVVVQKRPPFWGGAVQSCGGVGGLRPPT